MSVVITIINWIKESYYTSSYNKLKDMIEESEKELEVMKQNYYKTNSNKLLIMIENMEQSITNMKTKFEKIKEKAEPKNE